SRALGRYSATPCAAANSATSFGQGVSTAVDVSVAIGPLPPSCGWFRSPARVRFTITGRGEIARQSAYPSDPGKPRTAIAERVPRGGPAAAPPTTAPPPSAP